ncbi:MAG: hypothetical protein J3R72DRAFT_490442 [Linnemannia gamsii]|nr:MAG: hypothetical protein J3R72DRAFT_490442 [Linnemannia gamsii]
MRLYIFNLTDSPKRAHPGTYAHQRNDSSSQGPLLDDSCQSQGFNSRNYQSGSVVQIFFCCCTFSTQNYTKHHDPPTNFFQIKAKGKRRQKVSMSDFNNKVILIVNDVQMRNHRPIRGTRVTVQTGLYKDKGSIASGFPRNQFGGQSSIEIEIFSQVNFGVTFPLMAMVRSPNALAETLGSCARADHERIKSRSPAAQANEAITGDLWVREQDATATLPLPSLADIESRLQKDRWVEKQVKQAELDMAVDTILRLCGPEPCLIAIGNGTFKTGLNLASKHERF